MKNWTYTYDSPGMPKQTFRYHLAWTAFQHSLPGETLKVFNNRNRQLAEFWF